MNIAICDDSQYWQTVLKDMVSQWADSQGIMTVCALYASTHEFMQAMTEQDRFDLILLDIEFEKKMEGIEISKKLREMGCATPLVFTSGHAWLAIEGYYVDALGFLAKPVPYENLVFFLNKVKAVREGQKKRTLKIITATTKIHIPISEVAYVESFAHDLLIHSDRGEYKMRQTMPEIMEQLGEEEFIRVHRIYVVALNRIVSIKTAYPHAIELDAGNGSRVKISVGRTYFKEVQGRYASSIREVSR